MGTVMKAMAVPVFVLLLASHVGACSVLRADSSLLRFEFRQPHMGTMVRVVLYSRDEDVAREHARRAFARIAELDARLTDYGDTSELLELSRAAGGAPRKVSEDLFCVLEVAHRLSERTGGAFDVTIGPVSTLWRRARIDKQPPPAAALAEAQRLVGYRDMQLDAKARTVRLARRGMQLDLGGIGKGFAADEALKVLRESGARPALVSLGGDIVTGDPPPGKAGWQIAIGPLGKAAVESRVIRNSAVSTSGDAEQFLEHEGQRLSHVLDPLTGRPKIGRKGVTVIAADGMTADALSTAVGVMGVERGLALVDDTPHAAALYVEMTPDGVKQHRSKRW